MSVQSEKYLEERVQSFLDSEVLKGDKEKVLYLRLYNRLRPFKEKKVFSDQLAFRFFERDCREDYDSLGFGGLSDVVEQSQMRSLCHRKQILTATQTISNQIPSQTLPLLSSYHMDLEKYLWIAYCMDE